MRWAALLLVAGLVSSSPLAQPAESTPQAPRHVLLLNDGDPTLPAFLAIDRGFSSVLAEPARPHVDLFYESLDMLRFPEARYENELVSMLAKKYEGVHLDAVVTLNAWSLSFATRHRAALWPDAFIVSGGVPPDFLQTQGTPPRWTGYSRGYDIAGTAGLALQLRPATRRLVVVSGAGAFDRTMASLARAELAAFAKQVRVEFWEELPLAQLLARASGLPDDAAILYLSVGRDGDGVTYTPREVLKRLSAASRAPVYGPFETFIGFGVVGGSMYSFEASGQRLAQRVFEILALPAGAPLPPPQAEPSLCMAHGEEMSRHGLSRVRLPAGCVVTFTEPSLWREYRWQVLAALTVILAQLALIAALVFERRARARAEGEASRRGAELARGGRLALAGQLTASIAHEINQPLGAILMNAGAAEVLLERDPASSGELKEIVEDIRKADMRATEIVRRVRALVTNRQIQRESVPLDEMIGEVVGVLRDEALRRGVTIETDLAPGLPALFVDRIQLQQCLVNLCINAMEAMADLAAGARRLGLRTSRGPGASVVISVSDTGPGVPPEQLPRLFDSFFTTKPNGTGLGLSITRIIAETHGGSISAENRQGGGATFRLLLPATA